MITQSEYIRKLSEHTHFTLPDLMSRANKLREVGMLKKGGRGLSAVKIEADEAALIFLAAMSGASANTCPDAVRKLSALENTRTIDLGKLPRDCKIKCIVDGEEIEEIALKDFDSTGVDMSEAISLCEALTEILGDPLKADLVKSFAVDHINGFAIIAWADGQEQLFGKKNDEANSGVITTLHGRVFRLLACAILPEEERHKDPAYFEWVKQVVKIGSAQGEEAAEKWMKENPFKTGKA